MTASGTDRAVNITFGSAFAADRHHRLEVIRAGAPFLDAFPLPLEGRFRCGCFREEQIRRDLQTEKGLYGNSGRT